MSIEKADMESSAPSLPEQPATPEQQSLPEQQSSAQPPPAYEPSHHAKIDVIKTEKTQFLIQQIMQLTSDKQPSFLGISYGKVPDTTINYDQWIASIKANTQVFRTGDKVKCLCDVSLAKFGKEITKLVLPYILYGDADYYGHDVDGMYLDDDSMMRIFGFTFHVQRDISNRDGEGLHVEYKETIKLYYMSMIDL